MKYLIGFCMIIVLSSCNFKNENQDFNIVHLIKSHDLQHDVIKKDYKEFTEYISSGECEKVIQITRDQISEVPCYIVENYPFVEEDFSIHVDSNGNLYFDGIPIQLDNLNDIIETHFKSQDGSERFSLIIFTLDKSLNSTSLKSYFIVLNNLVELIQISEYNYVLDLRYREMFRNIHITE